MTTRLDTKIRGKRARVLCSVVVMMLISGITLLAPDAQVAVMASDPDDRPVAAITGTLLVYVGHTVYLDASESYDPGGNSIDYQWKLTYNPRGSLAIIGDYTDSEASFTADKAGVYQVQLIVNNGFRNSKPAYATITCIDRPYFW